MSLFNTSTYDEEPVTDPAAVPTEPAGDGTPAPAADPTATPANG